MKFFKKPILLLLGGVLGAHVYAQENPSNNVKLNLLPLLGKTISVEYERAVSNSFSLNATVAYASKGSLPFVSSITDIVESQIIEDAKLGNFALALEGRFYLNKKKGAMEGFYLAPFVKNAKYNVSTKVDYELSADVGSVTYTESGSIPVTGNLNAFSGGVAIGLQWIFANRLTLDWRIIGPSYGVSNGNLHGQKTLTPEEQAEIRSKLNDLASDLPLMTLKSEVDGQGVKAKINGPWAGIRTGLSIGYSF